jgi:hypothetical protein
MTARPSIDIAATSRPGRNSISTPSGSPAASDRARTCRRDAWSSYSPVDQCDEARKQVDEACAARTAVPVLVLANVDAGSDGTSGIGCFGRRSLTISFLRNMPEDFLGCCIAPPRLSATQRAIRECSFLGVPAVNIGTRQLGRERGRNVIDVDHDCGAIAGAIREHIRRGRPEPDRLYGDGHAGTRIADTLATNELRIEKRLTY